ncbi:hypothetical protein FRC09_008808 [Ceratobasidium sp. 395]|nr:hypothetical protein FRC09_008808 [Ceratobasidium sp. 395]
MNDFMQDWAKAITVHHLPMLTSVMIVQEAVLGTTTPQIALKTDIQQQEPSRSSGILTHERPLRTGAHIQYRKMSDDTATSTALPQALLDRLDPEYRAFAETQPASLRIPLHTLAWSPAFRGVPGVPPPDLGQAPPVPVGSTRTIELYDGRFSVRVLTPEGERPKEGWPVLLFTHGGGWVMGSVETGSAFYTRACAGKSTAFAHINKLTKTRYSGGTLSAIIAQRASRHGIPLVLQIIFTPLTNATFSAKNRADWPPSMQEYEHVFALRALDMLWLRDLYLPNAADRSLPDASPLLQDDPEAYQAMPPAFVGIMELDVLRSEAEMYAEKMRNHGVPVTVKVYKGATHLTVAADRACQLARDIRDDKIAALKMAFVK